MKLIYDTKDATYFRQVRVDLISLLPDNRSQKILEIGSGGGNTLVEIKSRSLASEVVGSDIFSLDNSNQRNPLIDKFIIADLEKDDLELPLEYFDVILAGDVLEHLVDPWKVIENLTKFLKKGGIFIVSVPNLREIVTISKVLFLGDFNYNPEGGIMDKTHLRFFCKKNVRDLFNQTDYEVKLLKARLDIAEEKSIRKVFNRLTLHIFEDFLTAQYIIIAKKIT